MTLGLLYWTQLVRLLIIETLTEIRTSEEFGGGGSYPA